MIRRLMCIAVFFIMITIAAPRTAAQVFISDRSGLYSEEEEIALGSMMDEASEHTGWNYALVTTDIDFSSEDSARREAERLYDREFGESSSGVLYLIDVGWRYIVTAGSAERYISGSRLNELISETEKKYRAFEDVPCAETFIRLTVQYYDKGETGFPEKIPDIDPMSLIVAAAAGAFGMTATCLCINKSYSAYQKPTVNNYIDRRTMNIYRRNDNFITTYVHRHKRSSGGSGGGHGGGGHHGGGGAGGHR